MWRDRVRNKQLGDTRNMVVLAGRVVLAAVIGGAAACDFDNEIDPYTEYYNLNGDWNAFTADDCKASCCNDPACTVWQFAQYPMGHQAQCMSGSSSDFGDSGGIQFTGEQGRGGPSDPGAPGGGHHHHSCVGVHCNDLDLTMFVILFGVAAGLYTTGGLYYGIAVQGKSGLDAVPNKDFWRDLGGLVKDGTIFAFSGGTAKAQPRAAYAPVPQVVVDPQAVLPALVVEEAVSALPAPPCPRSCFDLTCGRVLPTAVSWEEEACQEEGRVSVERDSGQESSREEVQGSASPRQWEQLRVTTLQRHQAHVVDCKCFINRTVSVNG